MFNTKTSCCKICNCLQCLQPLCDWHNRLQFFATTMPLQLVNLKKLKKNYLQTAARVGAPVKCAGEGGGRRAGGGWPSPHGVRAADGRANEGGRGRWGRGSRRSQRVGDAARAEGGGQPRQGRCGAALRRQAACPRSTRPEVRVDSPLCARFFFFSYF